MSKIKSNKIIYVSLVQGAKQQTNFIRWPLLMIGLLFTDSSLVGANTQRTSKAQQSSQIHQFDATYFFLEVVGLLRLSGGILPASAVLLKNDKLYRLFIASRLSISNSFKALSFKWHLTLLVGDVRVSGDADVCEGSSLVCFGISLTVNAGTFFFNSRWPNGFADCIDFFFYYPFWACEESSDKKEWGWMSECERIHSNHTPNREMWPPVVCCGKSASMVGLSIVKLVVMLILLLDQNVCVCVCVEDIFAWVSEWSS